MQKSKKVTLIDSKPRPPVRYALLCKCSMLCVWSSLDSRNVPCLSFTFEPPRSPRVGGTPGLEH